MLNAQALLNDPRMSIAPARTDDEGRFSSLRRIGEKYWSAICTRRGDGLEARIWVRRGREAGDRRYDAHEFDRRFHEERGHCRMSWTATRSPASATSRSSASTWTSATWAVDGLDRQCRDRWASRRQALIKLWIAMSGSPDALRDRACIPSMTHSQPAFRRFRLDGGRLGRYVRLNFRAGGKPPSFMSPRREPKA